MGENPARTYTYTTSDFFAKMRPYNKTPQGHLKAKVAKVNETFRHPEELRGSPPALLIKGCCGWLSLKNPTGS